MKRIILGIVLLSNLVFGEMIVENAMGCFNKSDAFRANMALSLGKSSIVKQYLNSQKCIAMNSTKNIKIDILKKEYQKTKYGKAIYIQYDLRSMGNMNIPSGKVTLWLATLTEVYNKFPLIK